MATKSKMSTSTTRKVTMKKPGPGDPPKNGSTKQTKEQYDQQWADYQKAYLANKDYSSKLSEYNKQKSVYDKEVALDKKYPKHTSFFGAMRDVTPAELAKINAYEKQNKAKSGETYIPYRNVKVNKKVTDIGDGSLLGKGAYHYYYAQPTAPVKPPPLGRQPYNPEYEPKLALKKPGAMGGVKSDSEPAKIIKPKLTTEVPVAIEKPTKKKLPKSAKADFVVVRGPGRFRSVTGQKITGKRLTKGKIEAMGFVGGDKTARKAVKAENKTTRAARRSFGREERLAAAYLKNQGIIEGDNKKEMKQNARSYSRYAKVAAVKEAANKERPIKEQVAMNKSRKQAVKTAKKAAKYVGLAQKEGKLKSFTPEALAKRKTVNAKVQTMTVGKGRSKKEVGVAIVPTKKSTRTQAGRAVY